MNVDKRPTLAHRKLDVLAFQIEGLISGWMDVWGKKLHRNCEKPEFSRREGMCFEIGVSEPSLVPLPPLVSEEVFQLLVDADYRTIGLFAVLFGNTAAAGRNTQEARRPYAAFQTRGGFFCTSSVIRSRKLFSEKRS